MGKIVTNLGPQSNLDGFEHPNEQIAELSVKLIDLDNALEGCAGEVGVVRGFERQQIAREAIVYCSLIKINVFGAIRQTYGLAGRDRNFLLRWTGSCIG